MKTLLLVAALSVPAAAQEAAPAAPAASVNEVALPGQEEAKPAPKAEAAPEPAAEPKEEPKAAEEKPEPEKKPEPEQKPEAKPEPVVEKPAQVEVVSPKVVETKPLPPAGIEEEWAFVKSAAEDPESGVSEAAREDLKLFVRRHPDSAQAPEALLLLAGLEQKKGEWRAALGDELWLLYEYPSSAVALRAKSSYLELVDKKGSRKQRPLLSELVKTPDAADKADRLSLLWQRVAATVGETLHDPAVEQIRDFAVRFPEHKDADKLHAALASLEAEDGKAALALLSWRKLLAMCPNSPLRSKAQMAIGDLYADLLRDPKKAIDAYQELVEKYPQAPEVLGALERSAQLFEDKLKQYGLAVEMDEKIVKTSPKTAGSLKALKGMAKLQRDRLSKPDDAVKTLLRLSSMHGGQEGVDALILASEIARRDLKDYARQAELLHKVSDDYAAAKEAPQALYDAAGVYEDELKDNAKAISVYTEVTTKFPSHKLAKKADGHITKLEAKQ